MPQNGGNTAEPPSSEELLRRAAGLAVDAKAADSGLADLAARQDISDRAQLAATVSTVFLISVPASLLLLILLSFVQSGSANAAVGAIVEILKSVLLPIVTLVLGYYFARGRN